MEELKIVINQELGTISTNFEEVKATLSNQMEIYKELEVTEVNKPERKKDIASLRKVIKAVNDKRISVKNECLKPYLTFEEKARELIDIINQPINTLDNQVKEFEEKQRLDKRAEITKIYESLIGELEENLPLDKLYNSKWENTATSIKSIKAEMAAKIQEVSNNVKVINSMVSDKTEDALEMFWEDLSLSRAIATINNYEDYKRRIIAQQEEKQRQEKEVEEERQRKLRERELERERERVRDEERARIRQEEQIKADAIREVIEEQEAKEQAECEAMAVKKAVGNAGMVTYKIIATVEEFEMIEMYMDSIGVEFLKGDF